MLADPVRLNSNLGTYTNFVNLMDLSALAVPAGFRPNGLPFGVTVVGHAFDDAFLARVGDGLHRLLSDAQLGETTTLASTSPLTPQAAAASTVKAAVGGAHLTGQPLHGQLIERKSKLVSTARTAPGYSFYALHGTVPLKPGLVFDGKGAGGIEVEVWEMDFDGFGSFVSLIPAPLGIGTVTLEDGSSVKCFLCELLAIAGAEDVTAFGGWRKWLAQRKG